jgi:nitrous oxidase accessory protein NosD
LHSKLECLLISLNLIFFELFILIKEISNSMLKRVLLVLCLLVVASVGAFPALGGTTITVKPSSLHGWSIAQESATGSGGFVTGPAGAPLGSGSTELSVDSTGQVILSTLSYAGTLLSQITELQYSAYRSTPDASNNLAINLQFDINYDFRGGGNASEGRLVYEPYQTPGVSGTILEDNWQTFDARKGRWWATKKPGSDYCPQSSPCTWSDLLAQFPYAAFRLSNGKLLFKAGGPWSGGFSGHVDAFTIGISGVETTYDFEPETACTTDCYVNATSGNDAFGGDTPNSAKQTIQAGIDAVEPGGTVHVAPGIYSETATSRTLFDGSGPYQFGIFVPNGKAGVTIQGEDDSGNPITDASLVEANVTTNATNSFGYSGIFVEADGVTLQGLRMLPNTAGDNKTIEVIGDAFSLKDTHLDIAGGGSLYFNDWRFDEGTNTSHLQSYTVQGNWFDHGTQVALASGAGYSGAVEARQIVDNTFTFDGGETWPAISFNGSDTGVPWYVYSVGGAVIQGNDFSGAAEQYIRARGTYDNSQFDWASYWFDNTYDKAAVAGPTPPADLRAFSYTSDYTFDNVRRIGATIQGEVDHAQDGDTVLVKAGEYPEQVQVSKSVHLSGEDGADQTFIQAPADIPPASDPDSAILLIFGDGVEAELSGFTIQGPGPSGCGSLSFGVFVRDGAAADIHDNQVLDIRDQPFSDCQNGVAIQVGRAALDTSGTATITDNQISGYQKNGITVSHTGSSAEISGNTLTGAGPTSTIAQNGIQVSYLATAQIEANMVSGHAYTSGNVTSTGILLYYADADTRGNTLVENKTGLYHMEGSGTHDGNLISASAAGTGTQAFWGMVIDAPPPGLSPAPMEDSGPPEGKQDSISSESSHYPTVLAETVHSAVVTNNEFTGDGGSAGTGLAAYAGFGSLDISLNASHNFFTGWGRAIEIDQCIENCTGAGISLLDLGFNSLSGNTEYGVYNGATEPAQAQANWWDSPNGPTHAGNPSGTGQPASDGVDYEPWLCDGSDTDPATGFQPDTSLVCGGNPPETSIDTAPDAISNNTIADFNFSASDDYSPAEQLTFECQLDGGDWEICTSPASFSDLTDGSHTFQARASDPAGVTDPTPASHTWKIDTQAPTAMNLNAAPNPVVAGEPVSFSATIDDSDFGGSPIASAEFSPNGGLTWSPVDPDDGTFDEETEAVSGSVDAPGSAGELELCVRGSDAAGNTGSPACTSLTITGDPGSPPIANPGGPYTGKEGQSVQLQGSASDPDPGPLTTVWSYKVKSGVKTGTTCTFGNKNALKTSFTCNDNGAFELTLTVSDGSHPPVSAKTTVAIANQPPKVKVTKPSPEAKFLVGEQVDLNATYQEAGANDSLTCEIDWGQAVSAVAQTPALTGFCQGSHAYDQPGTYIIRVTAVDDDAGSASTTVTMTVIEAVEAGNWVFMPVVIH